MLMGSCMRVSGLVTARRIHRTQHIVILNAETLLEYKIQGKISTGKRTWGEVQWKPGASFQESHRTYSILPAVNSYNTSEMLST